MDRKLINAGHKSQFHGTLWENGIVDSNLTKFALSREIKTFPILSFAYFFVRGGSTCKVLIGGEATKLMHIGKNCWGKHSGWVRQNENGKMRPPFFHPGVTASHLVRIHTFREPLAKRLVCNSFVLDFLPGVQRFSDKLEMGCIGLPLCATRELLGFTHIKPWVNSQTRTG